MLLPSAAKTNPVLQIIECGLTAIVIASAFAWPRIGENWFRRIESAFGCLGRKRGLAVASVGFSVLLLRLAILPIYPIPIPFVPDDFSFLLAADTFAHGRLTNPTPAMWMHFESIHITMRPTYMSMYFPGQGLLLAAGKVLLGNPWYGSLIASALMCAAICWMLQAWLPPNWALLGGFIAVLRLGVFSYWTNTYHAAGSLAALGGALMLGALPRLKKTARFRYGLLMAVGIALVGITRPYEGLLLCLPIAVVLGRWIWKGENWPRPVVLMRRSAIPLLILIGTGAWMGYYDYRAFGSPTTLPYTIDRNTYAIAPYYVWQSPRPEPAYRYAVMRRFYTETEYDFFKKIHSVSGFLPYSFEKVEFTFLFFSSFALLPPLVMIRRVFLDRRIRFLIVCALVLTAGMAIEIYLLPHYVAPFTAAFYAIGLQAMRHLRLWKAEGKPVGMTIIRLIMVMCVVLGGLRLFAQPLHLAPPEWPPSNWNFTWFGPEHYGVQRARIESILEDMPGKQLAIVRYAPSHEPFDEWVYNAPDIDSSKVVWAREMDAANNLELIHFYKGRKVWLVEPDVTPARISPYPILKEGFSATH